MSLAIQLVLAALIFAAGAAGGIKWHAGQDAIKENARLQEIDRQRRQDEKRVDSAAAGHEADKGAIRTQWLTITEEVERVVEKPIYRDVCLDVDGLRVLSDAIAPRAAASQPARAVPGPAAAD